MADFKVRTEKDLETTVYTYADTLFRTCLALLREPFEAEDVVQEIFLTYYRSDKVFESEEHKKAWLIRSAVNRCKNILDFQKRHRQISLDDLQECAGTEYDAENKDILDALLRLPQKFRIVLTLHYVEEYKVREIADILGMKESAVKMRLQKGRRLLEKIYREEYMP